MAGLIDLLILCVVVAIVVWLLLYLLSLIPVQEPFSQIARILIVLVGVLIILNRALPLLGISAF